MQACEPGDQEVLRRARGTHLQDAVVVHGAGQYAGAGSTQHG